MNFQPMNKADLIDWIMSHRNFNNTATREQLESMTKPVIIEMAKEIEAMAVVVNELTLPQNDDNDILESFDINNLQFETAEEELVDFSSHVATQITCQPQQMVIGDPGWNDYVLNMLTDNEFFRNDDGRKFPLSAGLRRVFTKLISRFYSSETQVLQVPTPENEGRATVVVSLKFVPIGTVNKVTICGSADIFFGNTNTPFCNFPVATAETIAESRAFKKALGISVSTADEIRGISDSANKVIYGKTTGDSSETDLADPERINLILRVCQQNKIDPNKVIWAEFGTSSSIDSLTQSQAQVIIRLVNDYNRGIKEIPTEIIVS